jgi:hypothetical protein
VVEFKRDGFTTPHDVQTNLTLPTTFSYEMSTTCPITTYFIK